jgi:hypothetical protein
VRETSRTKHRATLTAPSLAPHRATGGFLFYASTKIKMKRTKNYSEITKQWALSSGLERVDYKDYLGQPRIKYVKKGGKK